MNIQKLKKILGLRTDNCQSMADLRDEIDLLDQKIVEMIAIRQTYMDQAAYIKKDRNLVRDDVRIEEVIGKISKHAEKTGCEPELVSNLYRTMIEWSINYEFVRFDELKNRAAG